MFTTSLGFNLSFTDIYFVLFCWQNKISMAHLLEKYLIFIIRTLVRIHFFCYTGNMKIQYIIGTNYKVVFRVYQLNHVYLGKMDESATSKKFSLRISRQIIQRKGYHWSDWYLCRDFTPLVQSDSLWDSEREILIIARSVGCHV